MHNYAKTIRSIAWIIYNDGFRPVCYGKPFTDMTIVIILFWVGIAIETAHPYIPVKHESN
ncbi:hypothetical protein LOAG_06309 [Loa loa]|uniref:Uncharacterized protein n=1 Tax=Loa loa TaxID=7209 RepID=A0A1S0TYB9_LOALO|nr:hypothetical protein LOAG_06309 [Loa loa]EFO22176.1 hypothetical protein LOAG_06309 [Loa loa]